MNFVLGLSLSFLILTCGCRRQEPEGSRDPATTADQKRLVVDGGCPHMENGECQHATPSEVPTSAQDGRQSFGKPVGPGPEVALSQILERPDDFHDKQVVVEGHVSRACSRKGCWMEIAVSEEPNAPRCRVTFEDYGFFVPRDSAGSHARLEGRVQVTQVKPEAVKHYESEGAQFPSKSSDGSAREVRLVAKGVELERI